MSDDRIGTYCSLDLHPELECGLDCNTCEFNVIVNSNNKCPQCGCDAHVYIHLININMCHQCNFQWKQQG